MKDLTTKELVLILIDLGFQFAGKHLKCWSLEYQEQRMKIYNKLLKEIRARDHIEVVGAFRALGEHDERLREVFLKVLTDHN